MLYEITTHREGLDDNGKNKKFNESYIVDAVSILDAVNILEENIIPLYPEHEVTSVKKSKYSEVLKDPTRADKYYRAKYYVLTIDERTGAEKKNATNILIQADDYDDAKAKYAEMEKEWLADIELACISDTKILDYFHK